MDTVIMYKSLESRSGMEETMGQPTIAYVEHQVSDVDDTLTGRLPRGTSSKWVRNYGLFILKIGPNAAVLIG